MLRFNMRNRIVSEYLPALCCLASLIFALFPATVWAVDIDPGFQNTAAALPKTNVALSTNGTDALVSPDGFDPNNPLQSVNTITFQAFLDTGTSGIVLSRETAESFNLQKIQSGGNDVHFSDIAVGGSVQTNVSQSLHVWLTRNASSVNPEDPAQYDQKSGAVNLELTQNFASGFTPPVDIVGMPVMINKVVVIDPTPINSDIVGAAVFETTQMNTYVNNPTGPVFGSDNPGIPTSAYHVKLSSVDFSRFNTVTPTGAQGPVLANNPMIGPNPFNSSDTTPKLKVSYNGQTAAGSFLLDTGAILDDLQQLRSAIARDSLWYERVLYRPVQSFQSSADRFVHPYRRRRRWQHHHATRLLSRFDPAHDR